MWWWWLDTAEQTWRRCSQRMFWRSNIMCSMGIWITQWKTKPPQITTHTECTSGSGNPFSWRYLESGRGMLHMIAWLLFVCSYQLTCTPGQNMILIWSSMAVLLLSHLPLLSLPEVRCFEVWLHTPTVWNILIWKCTAWPSLSSMCFKTLWA